MRTPGKKPRFRRPKCAPRRRSAASRRPDGLGFNVFNLPLHSAARRAACGGASAASIRSGAVPGATGTTLEISGTTLVFPGTTLVFRAAAPVFRAKDEKRDTRGGCPSFDCSNLQKTGETAKSAPSRFNISRRRQGLRLRVGAAKACAAKMSQLRHPLVTVLSHLYLTFAVSFSDGAKVQSTAGGKCQASSFS